MQVLPAEICTGSARFRGGAKALDIWRLETKVEVLFEDRACFSKLVAVHLRVVSHERRLLS